MIGTESTSKTILLSAILFALLSLSLITPIGSILGTYDYVPNNDFSDHVAATIQAKMAIDEGQFPIRVAPWEHQGLRYAEYQFYGFFPYMLSGYLYKIFSQSHHAVLHNPFNTLKLLLFLSISLGGFFAYRFARLFTQSDIIAILAGIAYLFSPYLSINIGLRGDFTEAFAQGLLPIAFYYSFKMIFNTSYKMSDFIFSSLAWFAVLTSHLITFAYGALFFILALSLFFILKIGKFKSLFFAAFSLLYGCVLSAWFIIPIALFSQKLGVSGYFIDHGGNSPGLMPTSIMNLVALRSGGLELSPSWPRFYAAIGWPFLFGFAGSLYFIFWPKDSRDKQSYKLMLSVTLLFILALTMTWSWINFWRFLPYYFSVGQFGYRFLAQIMWLGIILFVLTMENVFGDALDARHLIIGIFLICLANASWIVKPEDGVTYTSISDNPKIVYGSLGYISQSDRLPPYPGLKDFGFIQFPNVTSDNKLILKKPIQLSSQLFSSDSIITLKGKMLHEAEERTLLFKLNEKVIAKQVVRSDESLAWNIPIGKYYESDIKNKPAVILDMDQIMRSPAKNLNKQKSTVLLTLLPIHVQQFDLSDASFKRLPFVPLEKIKPLCIQKNDVTECRVTTSNKTILQLPLLYYPNLINVDIDGKSVNYQATLYKNGSTIVKELGYDPSHSWIPFLVSTILVPTGTHVISFKLAGLHWANYLTSIAWALLVLLILLNRLTWIRRTKKTSNEN